MILPFCCYVLFSESDRMLYIGYSTDLIQRLTSHNNGKVQSTKSRLPLKLIFCEYYLFKQDAMRRESYFKTTAGKKTIRLMLHETLLKLGYKATELSITSDLELEIKHED